MSFDLATIGEILNRAREEKGLSVEQVSETLYLRKSMIRAIESGEWNLLPPAVYVKGYVTDYAKHLKVYDDVAPHLVAEKESPKASLLEAEDGQVKTRVRERRERPRLRKGILGGSVAAVAAITLLLFFHGQREMPLPPHYETVSRNSSESQASWPGGESKKLTIACHERTWIRILIDGAEKKEVMLNPEEVVMFTAKDTFDLLVGNAGGVKVYFNGRDTNFAGESGEVRRVTLP
jgi:cytoskeleton protein RodZ